MVRKTRAEKGTTAKCAVYLAADVNYGRDIESVLEDELQMGYGDLARETGLTKAEVERKVKVSKSEVDTRESDPDNAMYGDLYILEVEV